MSKRFYLFSVLLLVFILPCTAQPTPFYLDTSRSLDARVSDLISKLTLDEKAHQMMHASPAIPRLNIPAYNWWSEGLHGVARSGVATIFPQAIDLGATFDEDLVLRISTAISDEARAMYNAAAAKGYHQHYGGLTFWTPNINIFRDPHWGRGQETYGEDPFLTAHLGVAFVKGLQGNDPNYLKVAACVYWKMTWASPAANATDAAMVSVNSTGDFSVTPFYYVMKHFAKHIDAGYKRIAVSSDNSNLQISTFINPSKNQLTLVILNLSGASIAADIEVLNSMIKGINADQTVDNSFYKKLDLTDSQPLLVPAASITTVVLDI